MELLQYILFDCREEKKIRRKKKETAKTTRTYCNSDGKIVEQGLCSALA
jgi:hypothetical protein